MRSVASALVMAAVAWGGASAAVAQTPCRVDAPCPTTSSSPVPELVPIARASRDVMHRPARATLAEALAAEQRGQVDVATEKLRALLGDERLRTEAPDVRAEARAALLRLGVRPDRERDPGTGPYRLVGPDLHGTLTRLSCGTTLLVVGTGLTVLGVQVLRNVQAGGHEGVSESLTAMTAIFVVALGGAPRLLAGLLTLASSPSRYDREQRFAPEVVMSETALRRHLTRTRTGVILTTLFGAASLGVAAVGVARLDTPGKADPDRPGVAMLMLGSMGLAINLALLIPIAQSYRAALRATDGPSIPSSSLIPSGLPRETRDRGHAPTWSLLPWLDRGGGGLMAVARF